MACWATWPVPWRMSAGAKPDMLPDNRTAITVSELNEYARKLLAGDPLQRGLELTGEISGYKHH